MADILTNFTDFILKPAAPFAAGIALFGAVWGFFKGVESVLTDDTKHLAGMWPHRRSPQHQQFQELVDLSLRPQVIAGVGPLLSTDADRNDVAVHGEGILVSRVVTRVQDPVAPQAIPFVYEGFSFIGCTGHHQVHYLLAYEHTNLV